MEQSQNAPSQHPDPRLSEEQQGILRLVKSGHNVFFTGPAGTGKSVLLRSIIRHFRDEYDSEEEFGKKVAVTASTGIAARNIYGRTLHSWAGIGLGKEDKKTLQRRVDKSRWKSTRVLIIDEISMIDGTLFDKLASLHGQEWLGRMIREDASPFGGIQLIITGDFFQLPPVPDVSHERRAPVSFAFQAESWGRCFKRPIFLTQVFRQADSTFVDILANLRHGIISQRDLKRLRELKRPLFYEDGILPTDLYPLRREVQESNRSHLDALEGDLIHYIAMDFAGCDHRRFPLSDKQAEPLLERMIALPWISLKVGAIVMLIMNVDSKQGLVNGTRGIVTDFVTTNDALMRGLNVAETPKRTHKEDKSPEPTPQLRPMGYNVFERNTPWPLVRFENGMSLVCPPLEFTTEGPFGNVEAARMQVPLILAWALSVHKSQGQTLARVKVNLGHAFEKGQVYVALSRAKSMDGLQIESFEPSKIMAHPDVIDWYRKWSNEHR